MPFSLPLKSAPENICILRLSALGDVCNVVPIVRTIQTTWPSTKITWVIGRQERDLVGDMDGVEFIPFDKKSGWRGILQLRKRLSGRSFAVLFMMQSALRASLISLAIPARMRLGFHRHMAKDFQWLFARYRTGPLSQPHVIDGFFSFLEALGLDQRHLEWNIPIPKEASITLAKKIGATENGYIVVSPCASDRFRNWRDWPAQKYARVIDHAFSRHGLGAVLTGGPTAHEDDMGRRINAHTTHRPTNLIGRTTIKELLALIEHSLAVISPDSGPVHMANALSVPPIGLYVTSNPARTGPYTLQKWVVNEYPQAVHQAFGASVDAIPWGKRVRDPGAIELITVKAVKKKLDQLLAHRNAVYDAK